MLCYNKMSISFCEIEHEAYREEVCYFMKSICQEMRLEEALLSEIIFTKNFKEVFRFRYFYAI